MLLFPRNAHKLPTHLIPGRSLFLEQFYIGLMELDIIKTKSKLHIKARTHQ